MRIMLNNKKRLFILLLVMACILLAIIVILYMRLTTISENVKGLYFVTWSGGTPIKVETEIELGFRSLVKRPFIHTQQPYAIAPSFKLILDGKTYNIFPRGIFYHERYGFLVEEQFILEDARFRDLCLRIESMPDLDINKELIFLKSAR